MNDQERDELLVRIDERVQNLTNNDIPEIKEHLGKIDCGMSNQSTRLTRNETTIKYLLYGGGGTGVAAAIAKLLGLY